jgi:branched-chain amino acid transport system substrate-binding protein
MVMAEALAARQAWAGTAKKLGVAMTALALAACQTVVPRRAPTPTPTPTPTETPRPIGPELPDDANRHRIALLVPLSGANAAVGQSIDSAGV